MDSIFQAEFILNVKLLQNFLIKDNFVLIRENYVTTILKV